MHPGDNPSVQTTNNDRDESDGQVGMRPHRSLWTNHSKHILRRQIRDEFARLTNQVVFIPS